MNDIPVIDLEPFLSGREQVGPMKQLTEVMTEVGVVIVRDPRFPKLKAEPMRQMMQKFYRLSEEEKRKTEDLPSGHNVGWTPPFTETPSAREEIRKSLPQGHEATSVIGSPDPKERFMIAIGPRPAPFATKYPEYNRKAHVVPAGFPEWESLTTEVGEALMNAVFTVVEMVSVGLGCLDPCAFVSLLNKGPHVMGPTGCDLKRFGKAGTVHAGFHNDMGFCTIHGKSNYPGLRVWTRNKRRIDRIVMPDDGCLLIQASKQWQETTGGVIHAGLHEVVASPEMEQKAAEEMKRGLHPYRVSITEFVHMRSDAMIQLYDIFDTPENRRNLQYTPVTAGGRMRTRFAVLGLDQPGGHAAKGGNANMG